MSTRDLFVNGISSLLQTAVFPGITKWLKEEHNLEVSTEDLNTACDLPVSFPGLPATPNFMQRGKRTSAHKCEWIIQREPRRNQPCGKPATEFRENDGKWYCKMCIKKGAGKEESGKTPESTVPVGTEIGTKDNLIKLKMRALKGTNGRKLYETINEHLVIEQHDDKTTFVYGILKGDFIEGLTDQMKKKCIETYGLIVRDVSASGFTKKSDPVQEEEEEKSKEEEPEPEPEEIKPPPVRPAPSP